VKRGCSPQISSPLGERIKVRGRRPRKYVLPARMPLVAAPPHLPVAAQRVLLSESKGLSPPFDYRSGGEQIAVGHLHPIALAGHEQDLASKDQMALP
jgi:hypothetical protein